MIFKTSTKSKQIVSLGALLIILLVKLNNKIVSTGIGKIFELQISFF